MKIVGILPPISRNLIRSRSHRLHSRENAWRIQHAKRHVEKRMSSGTGHGGSDIRESIE